MCAPIYNHQCLPCQHFQCWVQYHDYLNKNLDPTETSKATVVKSNFEIIFVIKKLKLKLLPNIIPKDMSPVDTKVTIRFKSKPT